MKMSLFNYVWRVAAATLRIGNPMRTTSSKQNRQNVQVMSTQDNSEFKFALRDIALHAPSLPNTYDRVRCSEWARKLAGMPDDDLESSKTRNEYIQFLRIQVRNNFLHGPFLYPPPENQPLSCLSEHLGNMLARQIPYLPRTGPIAPMVHHRAPDGRAFISVKQIPGGGVLCYMAVSPDGFE